MNSTWLGLVLSTTESLLNNDTAVEVITEDDKEDYEEDENEWFHFEIQGKIYMTFILIIASLGLVGNVMSFILMSDAKLRSLAYSVYLRWMAVSDSLLLIMVATEDTLDTYNYLHWFLVSHVTLCKIWFFILTLTYTLSPWLVVALTLDRFVCVVFPLSRHRLCTKSKAFKLCLTLTLLSAASNVHVPIYPAIEDDECVLPFPDEMEGYILFQRLVLNSTLPCVAVLILNMVTVSRIRRSAYFRQQFKRSGGPEATKERPDKSTLPLLLISIFAFVTLIPRAVTEVTESVLGALHEDDSMTMELANKLWPLFNLIYLVNFGQNFYILIASSSEYRRILRQKLTCQHKGNMNTSSAQTQSSRMSSEFCEMSVSKVADCRPVTSGDTGLCSNSPMSSIPVTELGI